MKKQFKKPAELLVHLYGGYRPAARQVGKLYTSIYMWCQPRSLKGCDGFIPLKSQRDILATSKLKKLGLTEIDLAVGRNV